MIKVTITNTDEYQFIQANNTSGYLSYFLAEHDEVVEGGIFAMVWRDYTATNRAADRPVAVRTTEVEDMLKAKYAEHAKAQEIFNREILRNKEAR